MTIHIHSRILLNKTDILSKSLHDPSSPWFLLQVSVPNPSWPQDAQCGSWRVSPGDKRLSHIGVRRALVGFCPVPQLHESSVARCGVGKITLGCEIVFSAFWFD